MEAMTEIKPEDLVVDPVRVLYARGRDFEGPYCEALLRPPQCARPTRAAVCSSARRATATCFT